MARKIWMLSFRNFAGFQGTAFVCKESVDFAQIAGTGNVTIVYDGVDTGIGEIFAFATIVASADPGLCPDGYPFYADESSGCVTSIDPNERCDCLNGGCVPKSTYGTPGVFPNLAACQSGCAQNSNCDGECVSAAEIAALQQAADQIRHRLCG